MKIMVFRNGGPLKRTENCMLYGDTVTPKLTWTVAKGRSAAQTSKAIHAIRPYQLPFGQFSHKKVCLSCLIL